MIALVDAPPKLRMACFASVGAFLGMGVYVARISDAVSYMTDDPEACLNCHIMTPMYASWQHSSHARAATCNDCHVPHDSTVRKLYFKAMDGMRHSTIFTLRREPEVIKARPESRVVIQQNCIRCHTHQLHTAAIEPAASRSCIECHREVPHGRVDSLSSTPNAAVPIQSSVVPEWIRRRANPPTR